MRTSSAWFHTVACVFIVDEMRGIIEVVLVENQRGWSAHGLRCGGLAVRDILRAEGLEERMGYSDRRIGVADVIDEFQGGTESAQGPRPQEPAAE
jgi:hypothetical protein